MTAIPMSSAGLGTATDRVSLFAGTFLVAFALLAFEINTVRTINFAVGPSLIYLAIALAMLGLSGASSLLSLFDIRAVPVKREILLFWLCVAIAALLVFAHFLAADQKELLNAAVAEAGRANGLRGVLAAGIGYGLKTAFVVGIGLSLPYFLFGALLALLFTTTDNQVYGRLYASDLVGAAVGCMAAILVMETTEYAFSVTAPAVVVLLAGAAYVWPARRMLAAAGALGAVALSVLPRADWYAERIEPAVNANYLARDYRYQEEIREVWHDWNSYTRVGAVVWDGPNARPYAMMSLANGDGMAWVWPYETDAAKPLSHPATKPAMLLDPPRNALVMFAGAGADLMSLHQFGNGTTRVTGVELNAELIAGAQGLHGYRVTELLGEPKVDLQIAEGRVFLERDTQQYDQILLSFSGATASYYAGALGGTTQFLFTYEGLEAIFRHLMPDGYAVILQVNKVNVIGALRRYLDRHAIDTEPARTVVVLFKPGDRNRFWTGNFDNNPLLFKPAGWSEADVARLERNAAREGYSIAYAPWRSSHPEYEAYARVVEAADPGAALRALSDETGLRFEVVTDDRPFYLDLFANGNYVDPEFWETVFAGKVTRFHDLAHVTRVIIVAVVAALAFIIILGPLAVRRGPPRTRRSLYHLTFFFCLGAGFMLLEIGIMQRASLLFGNPGLAIAIVLGALILFTGLGSFASDRVFRSGLSHGAVAAAAALYAISVGLFIGPAIGWMLAWPLAAKTLGLVLLIAPGGLVVGQLFPQGLALAQQDDTALVPWAWAINGALSTVTAGAAPILAQAWGTSILFFGSAALYAVILLLPPYRRLRRAAGAA
jgi:spermidine synthase